MVTAIVGGAILPLIMGFVADNFSVMTGFIIPLFSILYISWSAIYVYKKV